MILEVHHMALLPDHVEQDLEALVAVGGRRASRWSLACRFRPF
jgi:hypothetical protein